MTPQDFLPHRYMADPSHCDTMTVGDRVKSFDFECYDDCYYAGVLLDDTEVIDGCTRYTIQVEERIWNGQKVSPGLNYVHPPKNGTLSTSGRYTNFVQKYE